MQKICTSYFFVFCCCDKCILKCFSLFWTLLSPSSCNEYVYQCEYPIDPQYGCEKKNNRTSITLIIGNNKTRFKEPAYFYLETDHIVDHGKFSKKIG